MSTRTPPPIAPPAWIERCREQHPTPLRAVERVGVQADGVVWREVWTAERRTPRGVVLLRDGYQQPAAGAADIECVPRRRCWAPAKADATGRLRAEFEAVGGWPEGGP